MLMWIIEYFKYEQVLSILVRILGGTLTAFFMLLLLTPYFINILSKFKILQVVRLDILKLHHSKFGVPTMGGIIIIFSVIISTIIWSDLSNLYTWIVIFTFISYGSIGLVDDYFKIFYKKNRHGLSISKKYVLQSIISIVITILIFITNRKNPEFSKIILPFFSSLHLGIWYFPLVYFIIIGTSNATNLTDGLDGLTVFPIVLVLIGFLLLAYFNFKLPYINLNSSDELMVICAIIIGSCLGFLWFNAYPAKIFMGDVGSLPLGAVLGVISVLMSKEFILFIIGSIFIIETLSVMIQIISFKIFGKRVFRMAPIHHHYEIKGYLESHITIRFWIISLISFVIGVLLFI